MKAFAIAGFQARKMLMRPSVLKDLKARAHPMDHLTIFDSDVRGDFWACQAPVALKEYVSEGGTYFEPVLDWAEYKSVEELIIYSHGAFTQGEYNIQFPTEFSQRVPRHIGLKISYVLFEGSYVEPTANVLAVLDGSPVHRWNRHG